MRRFFNRLRRLIPLKKNQSNFEMQSVKTVCGFFLLCFFAFGGCSGQTEKSSAVFGAKNVPEILSLECQKKGFFIKSIKIISSDDKSGDNGSNGEKRYTAELTCINKECANKISCKFESKPVLYLLHNKGCD